VAGEYRYRPAWWLPGGHLQTLWGKFARERRRPELTREVITMPDGDSLELHTHQAADQSAPQVLLLHGLEGTLESHYVSGIISAVAGLGWGATLMLFRGCGGAPNTARRFYHSGETSDAAHVYSVVSARHPRSAWYAIGVSLGGNVLLKWLGESGAETRLMGAAAISVPFDLEAGARKIGSGVARIYDRNFLRSLRRKALAKLERYPDLFDRDRLVNAATVFEFDEAVTAPVHGFADAHDYYSRSSSLSFLPRITVPTLLLSARDDPFLPQEVLGRVETAAAANPVLRPEFVSGGGHVGFVGGAWPWSARYYAEERAVAFLAEVHGSRASAPLP
jgi:predicted alpha/beta-fold hydrolase